jgi:hypothetical protein
VAEEGLMSTYTLDTAPAGSIVTIGHPGNGATATKQHDGRWLYNDSRTVYGGFSRPEVEYDDLHKTAQIVWAPPTGTVDPNRDHSEEEVKALVAIEATERLVKRALAALDLTVPGNQWTRLLLEAATDVTTTRTCTAVKQQNLSDEISLKADEVVDREVKKARRIQTAGNPA